MWVIVYAVALAAGLVLLAQDSLEGGVTLLAVGGFGLLLTLRRFLGLRNYATQARMVTSLVDEVQARKARGESPEQIATELAPRGIAPTVFLELVARDALRRLGHGIDRVAVAATIEWFGQSMTPPILPEIDLAQLDAERTLHAMTADVHRFEGASAGATWHGVLIATRRHLFFLTDPGYESLPQAFAKGLMGGPLPTAVSLANLGLDVARLAKDSVGDELSRERLAQFATWLHLPGSLAVSWRDITAVAKVSAPDGSTRVDFVVAVTGTEELRFRLGTGLKESFTDDWVDLTRIAALLEGSFLPPLS